MSTIVIILRIKIIFLYASASIKRFALMQQ